MKLFALSLLVSALFSSGNASPNIVPTTEIQDLQTGTLMVLPPQQTDTGTKRIPDAQHPFIPPGPHDQRGPCPAMNTLANHGYVSRDGITTFEEIILAGMEAFNIDRDTIANMAAVNMITRGNPFVNKISIGGISPLVPPLPYKIDGPYTQGIQKHGRVEGDASLTRSDAFIGDNRNFNQTLWDMDLVQLAAFGDDGPDGPKTVFNLQSLIEIKRQNYESDQALNPKFALPPRRLFTAYGGASLIMTMFANGTTKQATRRIMTSFFMNQTFPENWFRAAVPVTPSPIVGQMAAALPQWRAGGNNGNGIYKADDPPPPPFNVTAGCGNYWDQLSNGTPGSLAHVTGIFKQNVDLLNGIMFRVSGCPEQIAPAGPTNV
ncbi:Chloroperoxidase [Mycena rebaudengoi]|nr:Chloroperoxidase [Mycena rebaudengoi]